MIPVQGFASEKHGGEDAKDNQRDALLYHLELYQWEWPSIVLKANAIGWHLEAILKESYAPWKQDDANKWPTGGDFHFLQLQMPIPSEGHEYVGYGKKSDGV